MRRAALVLLLLLPVSLPVQAALRCGSGLVSEGQSLQQVLQRCGPPAAREEQPAQRAANGLPRPGAVDVQRWVYGPEHGMLRILHFIDGRLVRIESRREVRR